MWHDFSGKAVMLFIPVALAKKCHQEFGDPEVGELVDFVADIIRRTRHGEAFSEILGETELLNQLRIAAVLTRTFMLFKDVLCLQRADAIFVHLGNVFALQGETKGVVGAGR